MSYISKEEQLFEKIKKYVKKVRKLYPKIADLESEEIDEGDDGAALIQYMTNLHELYDLLPENRLSDKLVVLGSKKVKTLRNIASHDYDSINWDMAKQSCRVLIKTIDDELLSECEYILAEDKKQIKDYTAKANQTNVFSKSDD